MGNYIESFCHFVWATRHREPFITDGIERELHRYLRQRCNEMHVDVYALNGMPDHIHLAATVPTCLSQADFMERLKGSSSHFINKILAVPNCLYWQPGYGMLTHTLGHLPRVMRYVDRQKAHHASGKLFDKMERVSDID